MVQIGLKKEESGGFTYSVATFRKIYYFTGNDLKRVSDNAAAFREQAKESVAEREEQNKATAENNVELMGSAPAIPDHEGHSDIGGA